MILWRILFRGLSHTHVTQYTIEKYYITVKFDYGIRGVKTELRQKVLIQVYVYELHAYMLKKGATRLSLE